MSRSLQLTLIVIGLAVIALSGVALYLGPEAIGSMAVIGLAVALVVIWLMNA